MATIRSEFGTLTLDADMRDTLVAKARGDVTALKTIKASTKIKVYAI